MTPDTTATAIRFAAVADVAWIAELSRDRIEGGLGWSWTRPRVLRCLQHPESNVVVGVRGSERAGFGIMKYGDTEAHLLLLAVQPRHVRRGVGAALVAWLERSAVVAGIGRVSLEARQDNAGARAFYRRLGYAEIEVLPGYYGGRETCVRLARLLGGRSGSASAAP